MISKKKITEIARHVYKTLGPCHAESIYRDAMSIQLQEEGCIVKTEAPISIYFTTKNKKKMIVGDGRIDLLVQSTKKKNDQIVMELKCVSPLIKEGDKEKVKKSKEYIQLGKYLKSLKNPSKGLLINFPFPPREDKDIEIITNP